MPPVPAFRRSSKILPALRFARVVLAVPWGALFIPALMRRSTGRWKFPTRPRSTPRPRAWKPDAEQVAM
jgi:hypothetical protein